MEINYSTLETIEEYETLFKHFHKQYENYSDLDRDKRLIYLSAGLALSNSIHEKFVKSIVNEYEEYKNTKLSEKDKEKVIRFYKAPKSIKILVEKLNLNLEESFNLIKESIQESYSYIDSFSSLFIVISEQRSIRNDYLHGDFNFSDEIESNIFKLNILDFQQKHNFLFKIIRNSFLNGFLNLPNISEIIPLKKVKICKHCNEEL